MIEPKGDAGFLLMVSRRDFAEKQGLKLEIVSLKNGATAHKALLSGETRQHRVEPRRRHPGRRARRRYQDPRLRLAGRAARADGALDHHQGRGPQGQDRGGGRARLAAQSADQCDSGEIQDSGVGGPLRQSRRRSRPLQGGGRRRRRCRRRGRRVHVGRAQGRHHAGRRPRHAAELCAAVPDHDRQDA